MPEIKNSYYFPHDYHARYDPKICALIKDYGMEGYGLWWCIVEILHEQEGKIKKFPKMYEWLSHELKQNEALLEQIISSLICDYELLQQDKNYLWSDRVLNNIEFLRLKSLQRSVAGTLGGIKSGIKRSKMKQGLKQNEANEANKIKGKDINTLEATSFFYESYQQKFNAPYIPSFGKDGALVKNILNKISFEDYKLRVATFFTLNDSFLDKAGYTIGVFNNYVNKITPKPVTRGDV